MLSLLYIAPNGRTERTRIPESNRKKDRQIRGFYWKFAANLPEGASMVLS